VGKYVSGNIEDKRGGIVDDLEKMEENLGYRRGDLEKFGKKLSEPLMEVIN
jgi:hypothetical protein